MLNEKPYLRRALTTVALLLPAGGVLASACTSTPGSSSTTGTSSSSSTSSGSSSSTSSSTSTSSSSGTVARVPVTITGTIDTTFVTANHMLAAVEMQLSGEPLAESMGRLLTGYSRDFVPADLYFVPVGATTFDTVGASIVGTNTVCSASLPPAQYDAKSNACYTTDLVGFATAVDSYEYSKQPMNNLAFESGAGTSFIYGPLVNPTAATGAAALAIVIPRFAHYAAGSNASPIFVHTVDGTDPTNRLGWPGFWPTLMPYSSFNPTILATNSVKELCSISSDDDPNATGSILNLDYECDYNSLHLPSRDAALTKTLTPGASGWAGWKYSLWVLNYLQSMHDTAQTAIYTVAPGDLATVGQAGNSVVGMDNSTPPVDGLPGTFLGSSDIEGFQAQVMIDEVDNAAQQWLTQLTTTDGATLSGFSSVLQALQYNYSSPLRWFPGAVAVTETPDAVSSYPQPTGYAISDSGSHLLDLIGLTGEYATFYTLTDTSNTGVGAIQPVQAYFDGDPFPAQNQVASGQATLHDRALGVLRVLLVNIDRLHRDPTSGLLVDDVALTGGTPVRGSTISTTSVAYSIVGLRTLRRALTSQLQLYSNTTPDTTGFPAGYPTVLDNSNLPLTGAPGGAGTTTYDRLTALINSQSQLLLNSLTTSDGHALPGWNVSTSAATSTDDTLDAHTAAIRGLIAAYLATNDNTYLARAELAFNRMDSVFYSLPGLIYTATAGASSVDYTPLRFAVLEAALRDMYQIVGAQPGNAALGAKLQNRIARLIKLVLNGWDNISGTGNSAAYPTECINQGALPGFGMGLPFPRGGLQMAERALSGELGSACDSLSSAACIDAGYSGTRSYVLDRDFDCVPEISAAQLPSALANQVTFTIGQ